MEPLLLAYASPPVGAPYWNPPSTGTQDTLHWVYVAAMAAAALLFFAWSQKPKGVPRYEYLAGIFIVTWSGLMYAAMAMGYGRVVIDGQVTHYARYLDWVVTTPLLLFTLAATGMFATHKDKTLIAALMGTDAFMILSGLMADLTVGYARWVFYISGCVAFVVVLWLIWVPIRRIARGNPPAVASLYDNMALFLSVLWVGYPLFWAIGPSGFGWVNQTTDTFLFVALPIVSKAVWSACDLYGLRNLHDKGVIAAEGQPHPHLDEHHHYPGVEGRESTTVAS